jgi:hypothetical protein
MDELVRWMRASVLLQLQSRVDDEEGGQPAIKAEVLLADAGFSAKEIAGMLYRSPAAVAKAITRGRSARKLASVADASVDTASAEGSADV